MNEKSVCCLFVVFPPEQFFKGTACACQNSHMPRNILIIFAMFGDRVQRHIDCENDNSCFLQLSDFVFAVFMLSVLGSIYSVRYFWQIPMHFIKMF